MKIKLFWLGWCWTTSICLQAQVRDGFHEFAPKKKPATTQTTTSKTTITPPNTSTVTLPSLPKISFGASDSLFVFVENNQKFLIHKVKAGESLYSIKRFYAVDLSDIYYANPDLGEGSLRANMLLRIPILNKALRKEAGAGFVAANYLPVYYRVREKETMYRVSQVYFKIPSELLKTRNKLTTDVLNKNQVLHIGWLPKEGVPDSLKQYTGLTGVLGEENNRLKGLYDHQLLDSKKKETTINGVACWLKGERFSANSNLFVLYSDAPLGTILKIENTMFPNQFVYAQVVGKLPQNSTTEGAVVMVSPNVAFALGALDAQFFSKIYRIK